MGRRSSTVTRVTGDWLTRAATQRLFDIYEAAGFTLFFVGGCVRNALLDLPVSDLDMASDAPPDVAMQILTDAGLKVIPTGIDHGTVTVMSGDVAHEITTFRADVETDGRHAKVHYSKTYQEDAQRRDFTINALYADRSGTVLDAVGGLADIAHPRIRFIGDASARIKEDYLRALRFFRFHALYGREDDGFDPDAVAAVAANLDGLNQLSRERVGAEMMKLLGAENPVPAVMVMAQIGVLAHVLPGCDPRALGPFVNFEDQLGLAADPVHRLAAFADKEAATSLRLSRTQIRNLGDIRDQAFGTGSPGALGYHLKLPRGLAALALRHAALEDPLPEASALAVHRGADANFPITASDLQPKYSGPALGQKLRELESEWVASGFQKRKSQLLG